MIPVSTNPMKDARGRWRTFSLFYEHRQEGHEYFWTLSEEDREVADVVIPSLKKLYLEANHIPGYEYAFANEVLGSWVHWERLCASCLMGVIAEWKAELEIKIKASSMKIIINTSVSDLGPSSLQAAKYLADKGYASVRGRPSKAELKGNLAHESGVASEIADDLERVGLKDIK